MTPKEITNGFKSITALVVGDVMLDAYLWGRVDRISPEAPGGQPHPADGTR